MGISYNNKNRVQAIYKMQLVVANTKTYIGIHALQIPSIHK